MTSLWIRHKRKNLIGRIVGYCPDRKGRPQAIVQVRDKLIPLRLGEFRIIEPPQLREAA